MLRILSTALLVAAISPLPAVASPRTAKVAQARRVKVEIDRLDVQTELAAEDYNAAHERYEAIAEKKRKTERRIAKTKKRIGRLQRHLGARADGMYRDGPVQMLDVLLGARSFEQFSATWDILRKINADDARSVSALKLAKADLGRQRVVLRRSEAEAKTNAQSLLARRRSIEAKLARRETMLRGLEREIAALQRAEEEQRRRAAQLAEAAARARPAGGSSSFPRPTRAARSEVVAIAKRYLGAPYQWGAEGPDRFDCSGFTMFVYRQVGVQLPRVSRDQINAGERVNRSDLQPGDLVFFGSPIHHVGMYVGGGMMINSPQTGDVVKISPLHSDYVGACRP